MADILLPSHRLRDKGATREAWDPGYPSAHRPPGGVRWGITVVVVNIYIWLIYGYYMVIIWLIMVNNNLFGGILSLPIWLFNSLPWKDPPMLLIAKPSKNGPSIPWLC